VGCDEIIVRAYAVGLIGISWRSEADIVVNPATTSRIQLRENDQIVVIG